MLYLKPQKIILTVFLFGILLSSGTIFNLSSSFSNLTDKNMKNAFALQEDDYYYKEKKYDFGYEDNNNEFYNYDNENYYYDYKNDKKDSTYSDDKKLLKEFSIDKKVITIDSDGNTICNIILDNIEKANNVTINISDVSMCNTEAQDTNEQQPPTTEPPNLIPELNITKNWFVCDNDGIVDCTIENEENLTEGFEGPDSILYTQCSEEEDESCQFVNDSGFEIIVNGTSNPTPNMFAALINTIQEVEFDDGETVVQYNVSEILSSEQTVENAIIDVEDVDVGDISSFFPPNFPLTFDSEGQRVFTANFNSDSVSIIELDNSNNVIDVDLLASGGSGPSAIAFDSDGQRVFTANRDSDSVSIIEIDNSNNVIDVDLLASGGSEPRAIAFDSEGQRVFTVNINSDSVSIIELDNSNNVIDVDLSASGGNSPLAIVFDSDGQRVFTVNGVSDSVSIIELDNSNNVIDVDLLASGGNNPFAIAFDSDGQRVFTANFDSDSVSIIELDNSNNVIDVDLLASGGNGPFAIAFDSDGQRVFTANFNSHSVSIIELDNSNNVIDVDLLASGGNNPFAIVFDSDGQRVFTANFISDSVSIIELDNSNNVIDVDLLASGGDSPFAIVFDSDGQRVFTANDSSNSVSIVYLPSILKICQDSGFDTGDIRTFEYEQETIQQTTCVNFSEQCNGNIDENMTETQQCVIDDFVVLANVLP